MANNSKKPSSSPSSRSRGGNPGTLVPGIKEGQQRGPDGRLRPKEPNLSTESTDMLAAMRHVSCQPASADMSFQQANFRKWMEEAPGAFHARLTTLEDAERQAGKVTAPVGPVKWDGKGQCPACGWPEEPPGPEELAEEWGVLLEYFRHKEAIERVLPYIDEFDDWLAQRATG
jgi:hypothetical protein